MSDCQHEWRVVSLVPRRLGCRLCGISKPAGLAFELYILGRPGT